MDAEEFDSRLWHYRAQVIRVIDGDTVVLLADTGFHGRHEVHVRIADLHAPELHEPGGAEARFKLSEVLTFTHPTWPIRVATRRRDTVMVEVTSFERYVADLYLLDSNGKLVNIREVLQ